MYTIKRGSWHYKFNRMMISRYKQMPYDFCSYWSMTVKHFFKSILLAIPVIAAAAMIITAVYSDPLGSLFVAIGIIGIITMALILTYISLEVVPSLFRKINANKSEKQPGIISMKYRSWKEQHCSQVKYED